MLKKEREENVFIKVQTISFNSSRLTFIRLMLNFKQYIHNMKIIFSKRKMKHFVVFSVAIFLGKFCVYLCVVLCVYLFCLQLLSIGCLISHTKFVYV